MLSRNSGQSILFKCWYKKTFPSINITFQIQVYIAFVSACITIPVNLFFVGVFRNIRPSRADSARMSEAKNNANDEKDDEDISQGCVKIGILILLVLNL